MIRATTLDPAFYQAWLNASRALPVERLETPRQYGRRWREAYRCRLEPNPAGFEMVYIFDHDPDYTAFMLRWA